MSNIPHNELAKKIQKLVSVDEPIIDENRLPRLAWNQNDGHWYKFEPTLAPVWQKIKDDFEIGNLVLKCLEQWKISHNASAVSQIAKLLRHYLHQDAWDICGDRIPFQNGIFNPQTRELQDYNLKDFVTWCLPYDFDPQATCEPIEDWLLEMMQNDSEKVELLLSYLYCIVFGLTHLQRYLECVGTGGTGKSTFLHLAIQLIGERNVYTTSLRLLSGRFELANLRGKRLIVIPDSEGNFAGSIEILKTITGQDHVPYEIKYGPRGTFIPRSMVLIARNVPMFTDDAGIARRRILMPFENQVPPDKRRNLLQEFTPYIPGLFNRLLQLDPQRVEALIRQPEKFVTSLRNNQTEMLINTHPLANWFFQDVQVDSEAKTFVGMADDSPDEKLYASYVSHCRRSHSKPQSLRLFSSKLLELCKQLKLEVDKQKDWQRGVFFQGLKLRSRLEVLPFYPGDLDKSHHVVGYN